MDILALKPNTITVELRHPGTGLPLGVSVECTSLEGEAVKAVERQIKNAALRSGRNAITAEKMDDNTVAILSAAIVGWTWTAPATLNGDANPPLTTENKRKLLSVPSVSKQIDAALGDEAAFFTTSASA